MLTGDRQLAAPRSVRPCEGLLCFEWRAETENGAKYHYDIAHPRRARSDLWRKFVSLEQASDERIRKFAGEWGSLYGDFTQQETVQDWRRYVRLAAALLRVSGGLRVEELGSEEDGETICDWLGYKSHTMRNMPYFAIWEVVVGRAVNKWFDQMTTHGILGWYGTRMELRQDKAGRLQVRPYAGGVLGVVITQIAYVITGVDEAVACSGCGNLFRPKRSPARGRRHYCPRCRKKRVPRRDATRDWRARSRTNTG
jgi:hypothetical protein